MNYKCIASEKNWIEQEAIDQLKRTASMDDVVYAVGMPDLHPGKGIPVGSAVLTKNKIYPHMIGNDIGCGMGLFQTTLKSKRFKADRIGKKLERIKDISVYATIEGYSEVLFQEILGTLGRGNHFIEFQKIEEVHNRAEFERLDLEQGAVFVLVHSGSRGYGDAILHRYIETYSAQKGLLLDSRPGQEYMEDQENALKWAAANREILAQAVLSAGGYTGALKKVTDLPHNMIEKVGDHIIHRKGAVPSDRGVVVIPGSRGTFSYLVAPVGGGVESGFSLAHGAGRKWKRSSCKGRLDGKYTKESIRRTALGSRVVCDDVRLLFEEAAEAYKDINRVIADLSDAGLIDVIATLRPLVTYKN